MNHLITKTLIAISIFTGSVGLANAGIVPNSQNTQKADLNFAVTGSTRLTITPMTNLKAGAIPDQRIFARYNILAGSGATSYFVVRWTPGTGTLASGKRQYAASFQGKNTANILKVRFSNIYEDNKVPGTGDWYRTQDSQAQQNSAYDGEIWSDGSQTIAADTYTISMDAAAWVD